jgi:hypothetical protein
MSMNDRDRSQGCGSLEETEVSKDEAMRREVSERIRSQQLEYRNEGSIV